MTRLTRTFRGWWQSLTGDQTTSEIEQPKVIVHDPEAERPHNLDDPFFDRDAQSRIAGVIAESARNDPAKKKH
jgi:hypothetical protein